MSKRNSSASGSTNSSKKARKHGFATPIPEDENPLTSQLTAPSSTSLSIRTLPSREVTSLVTLCARTFVANFRFLFDERREMTQSWLKALPEAVIPRLFAMLSNTHPTLLSHGLMIAYFLRGNPIVLSGSIPGVTSFTIQAVAKRDALLRECHLTDLNKISDEIFANLFTELPMCETLVLKGSTKVGKKSIDTIANTCKHLHKLNLNFTSAPPPSIAYLTGECLDLEVLKLAGINGINDNTFSDILHVSTHDDGPLSRLTHLKLRHTSITEQSLKWIGSRCIRLTHLDVSFTPIKQPMPLLDPSAFIPELEKLSLTSTPLTPVFLSRATITPSESPWKFLRTLHIGAIGASPSLRVKNTPVSLTLTDEILDLLTDGLYECKLLENISIVGNTKLGLRSKNNSSLSRFIRLVGRRCKILNLAAISRLKSSDLSGLPPIEALTDSAGEDPMVFEPSPIHTLNINNTDVDNEAAAYIATCPYLRILNVASTKFNYDALFLIVDACEQLTTLDLTSCRNVKIGDRRKFFEVWQDYRRNHAD